MLLSEHMAYILKVENGNTNYIDSLYCDTCISLQSTKG